MDNRYYENVIAEMRPFIEEQGFVSSEPGVFANGKKSFKVFYNEEKQMYVLSIAEIDEENNLGEYAEADAWLFDDSQTANDAASVGMDFVGVLKKNMGIKDKAPSGSSIELPTGEGDKFTVSAFTKKVLDTYPQLKDTYKNYVAQYGSFLYLNFFGTYLVPLMTQTINERTKKSSKKILDLVEPAFVKGDNDASNVAIACLGAVCLAGADNYEAVMDILSENTLLKGAVSSFADVLKKKKKLSDVLVRR